MKVSVCLVAYNAGKWVGKAIESIKSQTYKDFELITVNDGSTDNTETILKSYEETSYFLQEHKNFATGANLAISKAKGEFIMFVGADDILGPDYLEKMIAGAGDSTTDYFYPNHFVPIDETNEPITPPWFYRNFTNAEDIKTFMFEFGYSPIPHPGSLIRRALFDRIGGYDENIHSEDFFFLCQNVDDMKFKMVGKAGNYFYRRLETSASNTNRKVRTGVHNESLRKLRKSKTGKQNLLVCSPWDNCWLRYYQKYFSDKYNVRACKYSSKPIESASDIEWADIVIFNWSDWFLEFWSKEKKNGRQYIAFLRSYEIWDTPFPWNVDWSKIDHLVFVNPAIRKFFLDQLDDFKTPTHFIPNAIDLDEWVFIDREKNKKISWVNDLSHKKGIQTLAQFAYHMPYDYTIFPVGGQGDIRRSFYFSQVKKVMRLNSKIAPIGRYKNIQDFLRDKSFALSTSVAEGHPNAIIEAMAVGMKPIIHNWPGASLLFPEKYVYNTIDEAVEMLEGGYSPSEYRNFIERNYSLDKVYPQIEALF